jgi:hypothetical protein
VTAIVTTAGVIGAIFTIVLLKRQTKAARRAADMANRSNIVAIANARSAAEQAKHAEWAILLTHRPRIDVKEIEMPEAVLVFDVVTQTGSRKSFTRPLEPSLSAIAQLNASFRLTNIGAADATMHYMGGTVFIGPRLPHINPAIGKPLGLTFSEPLKPGYTTRIPIPPLQVSSADITAIRDGDADIYVVGKLIYHDKLKNYRRTGFARRFDMESGRFRPVHGDTDYEYEE